MNQIQLAKFKDESVRNLSQGNKRKLEMIIKIALSPSLFGKHAIRLIDSFGRADKWNGPDRGANIAKLAIGNGGKTQNFVFNHKSRFGRYLGAVGQSGHVSKRDSQGGVPKELGRGRVERPNAEDRGNAQTRAGTRTKH